MAGDTQHSLIRTGLGATTDAAPSPQPVQIPQPSAWLHVVHAPRPEQRGQRAELGRELWLLGREIEAGGFSIDDRRLSRTHARFTFDGRAGRFRVGDAGSRNGTRVNGQRIETQVLSEGDVIRAGDTLLVYSHGDGLERVRKQAEALARSGLNVLVRGETGTGKELLARHIHLHSGRKGAFVAANCASIRTELVSAEFFGHTKSAFSGATHARRGLFVAAEGGTLLLDEVGDCPLEVQAALLRAIQEKAVRPIGAEHELPVDVCIVAATNGALEAALEHGTFRADLYARLSQATLTLPPLRERKHEILTLCKELARERSQELQLSTDAAEALLLWHWPFNVRELHSLVCSFLALHPDVELDLALLTDVAPNIAAPLLARKHGDAHDHGEPGHAGKAGRTLPPHPASDRSRLRELLQAHGGNVSAVAKAIGKPRAQVYRWMKAMGLAAGKYRR
jgi:transcriptional regulator with GAF, ATPase, and Fis domain